MERWMGRRSARARGADCTPVVCAGEGGWVNDDCCLLCVVCPRWADRSEWRCAAAYSVRASGCLRLHRRHVSDRLGKTWRDLARLGSEACARTIRWCKFACRCARLSVRRARGHGGAGDEGGRECLVVLLEQLGAVHQLPPVDGQRDRAVVDHARTPAAAPLARIRRSDRICPLRARSAGEVVHGERNLPERVVRADHVVVPERDDQAVRVDIAHKQLERLLPTRLARLVDHLGALLCPVHAQDCVGVGGAPQVHREQPGGGRELHDEHADARTRLAARAQRSARDAVVVRDLLVVRRLLCTRGQRRWLDVRLELREVFVLI
mmetsp:Transcript_45850/g.107100  ORF Transcript_45850/g.107100 Transcript_45850/m.107100 type:complete len:322 (-) Transcript_45850:134-1099(-)